MDHVAARLDRFGARLESIQERTTTLGEHLQGIVDDRDESGLYELAVEIRRLTATAKEVQRDADDLQFELDPVEAWLETPDRRVEALTGDIDAIEESLGGIEATVETLSTDGTGAGADPAVAWAAASIQHRVGQRLAEVADPACRERFGDRIGSFEDELEGVEPPIEWAELEETIQRYQPDPNG